MLHDIRHSLSTKILHPNLIFFFPGLSQIRLVIGRNRTGTGSEKKWPDRPEPEPDFRSHTASKSRLKLIKLLKLGLLKLTTRLRPALWIAAT